MNNVLLIGDHPKGFSGNSHMISALIDRIDRTRYNVSAFACTPAGYQFNVFEKTSYPIIEGGTISEDPFGMNLLLNTINQSNPDIVMFVGLDLWRYYVINQELLSLKKQKKFIWISLFPYDFTYFRNDWLDWLAPVDIPLVYSEYGLSVLKEKDKRVRYFRPPLYDADKFVQHSAEKRKELRNKLLPIEDTDFVFGFFGVNQVRKDPLRAIKAFYHVKQSVPNVKLYLHTEMNNGVYNLSDYLHQMGHNTGDLDVFAKKENAACLTSPLVDIYNCCDCLLNTSLQEGLSWTLLEAMLCGVPVIGAYNTSQMELLKEGAGAAVSCKDMAFIPIVLPNGLIYAEAQPCDFNHLTDLMIDVATNKENKESLIKAGHKMAKEWLEGVSDINVIFGEAIETRKSFTFRQKKKEVLFVQYSSAGDVLMSTQCFKGIKEKHKWPLVYMTQPQYQDIVKNNPYIDRIIDYDEDVMKDYVIVYNPHGEKILPGGWNNLDVTLHSMYPYFCKVKPDDIFIDLVKPDIHLPEKYIVVHTTGGNIEYRSYAHMDMVISQLPYPVVQIGGKTDRKAKGALDLRGLLSFRETAYVMKHAETAVVIDSFPAHLAGALGTPVVVLFGPAPARVTQPKGNKLKMVFLEPNMLDVCAILAHCWSTPPQGKNKCMSPCINTISPEKIIEAVKKLVFFKEAEDAEIEEALK